MCKRVGYLNRFIIFAQVCQSTCIYQEHFSFGFPAQIPRAIGSSHFYSLFRLAEPPLTVGHKRQIIIETVHTVCCPEFAERKFIVPRAVRYQRQGFPCQVNAGSLAYYPLRVLERRFRIGLLQRISGKHVEPDILCVLFAQPP